MSGLKNTSQKKPQQAEQAASNDAELKAKIEKSLELETYDPGEETDVYHVNIQKGTRFDPITGKEIGKPYVQKFSIAEFRHFEKHAAALGMNFKVVHNPEE